VINGLDEKIYRPWQISTIIFEKVIMNFEINPISIMKDLVLEDIQGKYKKNKIRGLYNLFSKVL
jgi:hypothetical protein